MLTSLNEGKYDFKIFDAPTVNAIIKNNKLSNLKTIELKSDQQPYIYFLFADNQKHLHHEKADVLLFEDGKADFFPAQEVLSNQQVVERLSHY